MTLPSIDTYKPSIVVIDGTGFVLPTKIEWTEEQSAYNNDMYFDTTIEVIGRLVVNQIDRIIVQQKDRRIDIFGASHFSRIGDRMFESNEYDDIRSMDNIPDDVKYVDRTRVEFHAGTIIVHD